MKNTIKNLKAHQPLSLARPTKKAVLVVNSVSKEEVLDILIEAASTAEEDLGVEFISLLVQERELAGAIMEEDFEVEFIYACINTQVGQGILIGLLSRLVQMSIAAGMEDSDDSEDY